MSPPRAGNKSFVRKRITRSGNEIIRSKNKSPVWETKHSFQKRMMLKDKPRRFKDNSFVSETHEFKPESINMINVKNENVHIALPFINNILWEC